LEAVPLTGEVQPDVVDLDILMLGMAGLEVRQRIKKSWPEIVVIVLTIGKIHMADSLSTGADAFLVKKPTPGTLLKAILDPG